jgi:hypothetical protein
MKILRDHDPTGPRTRRTILLETLWPRGGRWMPGAPV